MEIREIKDGEASVAFSLHNRMNNADRTPDQWRWEYRGLMPEKNVFGAIYENGDIIGTQAMMPIYLRIGDRTLLTGKSENSLLDPRFRGGTHFTDLYEFCVQKCQERGMAIIWGFTPAVKVWRDKLHFNVHEGSLYYSRFVLDLNKQLKVINVTDSKLMIRIRNNLGTARHFIYSRFKYGTFKRSKTSRHLKVEFGFRNVEDTNILSSKLMGRYPDMIQIRKDHDFLQWRVYNNPNLTYRTLCVYEDEFLRGYVHYSRKGWTASIADLTYDDPAIGEILITTCITECRKERVASISFFGNRENPYTKEKFALLERMGFMTRKSDMSFVVRSLSDDVPRMNDIKRWCFDFLWLEGYNS